MVVTWLIALESSGHKASLMSIGKSCPCPCKLWDAEKQRSEPLKVRGNAGSQLWSNCCLCSLKELHCGGQIVPTGASKQFDSKWKARPTATYGFLSDMAQTFCWSSLIDSDQNFSLKAETITDLCFFKPHFVHISNHPSKTKPMIKIYTHSSLLSYYEKANSFWGITFLFVFGCLILH